MSTTNDPDRRPTEPARAGTVSDPDAVHPFGPDAPNVRDPGAADADAQGVPLAPPPSPPETPLDAADFAEDA